MATDLAPHSLLPGTLARVGDRVVAIVAYLGGAASLAGQAFGMLATPARSGPRLFRAIVRQWEWLFDSGLPLVGLVHVGVGSFLAMQAYYGATFVEGVGPVVGVGLFRNVAPLLSGMVMAGLLAARLTPELSKRPLVELEEEPGFPDRDPARNRLSNLNAAPPDPVRLAAVRIAAAMAAGPVLGFWGASVGTLVGWLVARQLLAVPTPIFFGKCLEMLWVRDVVGLAVKGVAFGLVAALFSCFEGLRGPRNVSTAAVRAARNSALAILFLNSSWYLLVYMAGPAFGPTVLTPPTR